MTRRQSVRGPGGDSKCVVLSDLMSAVWFLQFTLPQCGLKVRKLKNGPLVSFLLSAPTMCVFFVCLFFVWEGCEHDWTNWKNTRIHDGWASLEYIYY